MYATDVRQTDVRQKHRLMPLPYGGGGIINVMLGTSYLSQAANRPTATVESSSVLKILILGFTDANRTCTV